VDSADRCNPFEFLFSDVMLVTKCDTVAISMSTGNWCSSVVTVIAYGDISSTVVAALMLDLNPLVRSSSGAKLVLMTMAHAYPVDTTLPLFTKLIRHVMSPKYQSKSCI
jgi:hypothetical protein